MEVLRESAHKNVIWFIYVRGARVEPMVWGMQDPGVEGICTEGV
jgi:hypothetical protein